jgi:hypothetical protein
MAPLCVAAWAFVITKRDRKVKATDSSGCTPASRTPSAGSRLSRRYRRRSDHIRDGTATTVRPLLLAELAELESPYLRGVRQLGKERA